MHHGVFVDIMPHDYIPDKEWKRKIYCIVANVWKQLFIAKSVTETTVTRNNSKKKIGSILRKGLNILLKPISKRWLYIKYDSHLKKYNGRYTNYIATRGMTDSINVYSDIFPLREHNFEDKKIMIPGNAEKVMTVCYGDYMRLPPVENRVTHRPVKLKL